MKQDLPIKNRTKIANNKRFPSIKSFKLPFQDLTTVFGTVQAVSPDTSPIAQRLILQDVEITEDGPTSPNKVFSVHVASFRY